MPSVQVGAASKFFNACGWGFPVMLQLSGIYAEAATGFASKSILE